MRLLAAAAVVLAVLAGLASAPPAAARGNVCADAMAAAAARHGVPEEIILAVGRVESGFNPYAINAAGTPHFAEDAASAIAFVRAQQAAGIASIDVGCGQINLHWHPNAFPSLADAFVPEHNAEYAAALLARLYDTYEDWTRAVAHYHSGTRVHQQRYLAAITRALGDDAGALIDPGRLTLAGARLDMAPPVLPASPHHVDIVRLGIDSSPYGGGVRVFRAPATRDGSTSAGSRTVRVVSLP